MVGSVGVRTTDTATGGLLATVTAEVVTGEPGSASSRGVTSQETLSPRAKLAPVRLDEVATSVPFTVHA